MNHSTAIGIAALGGAILPLQFLINSRLGMGLNSPIWATTISFVVGMLGLFAWIAVSRQTGVTWSQAAGLPWWAWVGGLMGAVYVCITIMTAPVLGATALVLLLILGQMLMGTVLDHFGILTDQKPITLVKAVGLALAFAGTWLVVRS